QPVTLAAKHRAPRSKTGTLDGKIDGNAMTNVGSPRLTKQASKFWNAMPAHARAQILGNVYCAHCHGPVSVVNVSGTLKRGDLVLEGNCAKCGREVARLVEGPDA